MAVNITSNSIEVFPSTRRDISYQISSRSFNEKNAIAPIKRISENSSFIITDTYNANDSFEFIINGYYFKVTPASNIINAFENSNITSIYAYIIMDRGNNIEELYGIDDSTTGLYTGVNFQDTIPTESNYYLKLFERDSSTNTWSIPQSSKNKFSRDVVDVDVDGGVIS